MKLAPFFAISAALHAAGFFYPVRFTTHVHEELIPITVVAIDEPGGQQAAAVGAETNETTKRSASNGLRKNARPSIVRGEITRVNRIEEQPVSVDTRSPRDGTQAIAASISAPEEQSQAPQQTSSFNTSSDAVAGFSSSRASYERGAGGGWGSGQSQSSAAGSYGSSSGFGSGSELSQRGSRFIPPRFKESPRPAYPESAHREGKQGRVLLQVLVDQQGKAKAVEISSSSGSETLDNAAAQTIKRWRFYPARLGDQPVEFLLLIPIDFLLTERRN